MSIGNEKKNLSIQYFILKEIFQDVTNHKIMCIHLNFLNFMRKNMRVEKDKLKIKIQLCTNHTLVKIQRMHRYILYA